MPGDLINLRRERKRRVRAAKDQQATENRIIFGRSGTDRRKDAAKSLLDKKVLDGKLRDRSNPEDGA